MKEFPENQRVEWTHSMGMMRDNSEGTVRLEMRVSSSSAISGGRIKEASLAASYAMAKRPLPELTAIFSRDQSGHRCTHSLFDQPGFANTL
jgi:hypothetical protein